MPLRTSSSAPIRPSTSTRPAEGNVVWQIILSSVDLPEPLTPTMACVLPGSTCEVDVAQHPAPVAAWLALQPPAEELEVLVELGQGAVGPEPLPDLLDLDRSP